MPQGGEVSRDQGVSHDWMNSRVDSSEGFMWKLASMKGCCLGSFYGAGPMEIELKLCWLAMRLIFVGAHPVGDGLQ
jgi:hypothetical protein